MLERGAQGVQRWEYLIVPVRRIGVGAIQKNKDRETQLDPLIRDWTPYVTEDRNKDIALLAQHQDGYWTLPNSLLNDLGRAGWELIDIAPVAIDDFTSRSDGYGKSTYDYILKRPLA